MRASWDRVKALCRATPATSPQAAEFCRVAGAFWTTMTTSRCTDGRSWSS